MTRVIRSASMLAALSACTGGPVGTGDGIVEMDEVPEIGWEAEFVTRAHDVAGRAVIIDESTIELQDFTYDGGGVNARFFLLIDGEEFHDTYELTDNLVGQAFDEDTLTLDLPEGTSFEDFNLITLWCVPFRADFGSGVFQPPQ
ncbi:MAG: DM13 domain-containing protein [Myxococcales bacterium]|nr:DM13 domain-containing protein [Myxococcales bacterium]